MAFENFAYLPPGEHITSRITPEPVSDPVTWPGAYVVTDPTHEIPPRIREMHEYWEPTMGVQWYQIPRGAGLGDS